MLAAIVVLALIRFPFARFALGIGLAVYSAILYRYPNAWLVVVPAALPVLDLAPWSGWFFLDEFDLLVAMTLSVGLWKSGDPAGKEGKLSTASFVVLLLVTGSYLASLVIGLLPLDPLDANAFTNYYSHYNSLRMAKGYFEALALFLLMLRRQCDDDRVADRLITGMVLGLTGVVVAVFWERLKFTGLFDFTSDFRVTATFSGLHNGGNDPEAYLVLAQPFVFAWALNRRRVYAYVIGFLLFSASTYALLMTFSRGGYLGLGLAWVILWACFFWRGVRFVAYRGMIVAGLFIAAAVLVAVPVFEGSYIRSRFENVKEDWNYRMEQAVNTIRVMDDNWQTRMFGMGLGRYPEIFYARRPLPIIPATYRFLRDGDKLFLRLTPGSPLYFEQYVNVRPQSQYALSLKLRGDRRASLVIYLCEKNLLYSFRCAAPVRYNVESAGKWMPLTTTVATGPVGSAPAALRWILTRPVKLTLVSPGPDPVDVSGVRLTDPDGNSVLINGDFSAGMNRWFFATDNHLAWQVKNHWVQIYFDQGWSGVVSQVLFAAIVMLSLFSRAMHGHGLASIMLASLGGFLLVGLFGSLFDTPRLSMLFYLLALYSLLLGNRSTERVVAAREV